MLKNLKEHFKRGVVHQARVNLLYGLNLPRIQTLTLTLTLGRVHFIHLVIEGIWNIILDLGMK
jgi:hypothetical protein